MRYRMSVIYGHPVIAATRALRFVDHVTKRNGASGDENGSYRKKVYGHFRCGKVNHLLVLPLEYTKRGFFSNLVVLGPFVSYGKEMNKEL